MAEKVILITGSRKGIGRYLAEYYARGNHRVIGCSRGATDFEHGNYRHFEADVTDELKAKKIFLYIRRSHGRLDILINNAGIASMNHVLLTPLATARRILETNVLGSFLFAREAAKLMKKNGYGRIVNFSSLAVPLKLEGECLYAASKAAVVTMTEIMARELADFGITVNTVGPPPLKTDLIKNVPGEMLDKLIARQAISRYAQYEDILNTVEFFLSPSSGMVTGQVIYLGGA